MTRLSPEMLCLVAGFDLVVAALAGVVLAGGLRRFPWLRRWWVEGALVGGVAIAAGGALAGIGALTLGGELTDLLVRVDGKLDPSVALLSHAPWLLASLIGTFAGNLVPGVTAIRLGDRPAGAWPRWRWLLGAPFVSLGLIALASGWGHLLAELGHPPEAQGLAEVLGRETGWVRTTILVYVMALAPLVEELMFRGWLQGLLTRRFGARLAILGQALIFGAMHVDRLWAIPPLVLIGLACGWLRARSGSLLPGLTVHALNNSLAAFL